MTFHFHCYRTREEGLLVTVEADDESTARKLATTAATESIEWELLDIDDCSPDEMEPCAFPDTLDTLTTRSSS